MRALVIGGTGPTGPHIVTGLAQRGYDVTLLNRGTRALPELSEFELIRGDPHFAETLTEALGRRSFDLVVATYGRLRLLPEILRGRTERLVTVGGAAYSDHGGLPADEGSTRQVEQGLVKKIIETEAVLEEASVKGYYGWTHLRYPPLWGPRQLAPREWSILRRAQDGRSFIPVVDGGLTLESVAYVENAAHAVLLAVDQPEAAAGEVFNVADEESRTYAVRARAFCQALGRDHIELLNLPGAAAGPAAFWGINRDLDFAREGRSPDLTHRLIDISKIKGALGYRDAVSFDEGVQRTVEWFAAHPLAPGGDEEKQLGDPFDYSAEDAFAELLAGLLEEAQGIARRPVRSDHPYSHPTHPG